MTTHRLSHTANVHPAVPGRVGWPDGWLDGSNPTGTGFSAYPSGPSGHPAITSDRARAQARATRPERSTQTALPKFGPEVDDRFRFTWWNTAEKAPVWIEYRGRWRAGVVIGRGRKRALVAIEADGFNRLLVAKSYNQLCRRIGETR
jgi:hypothetical protein